MVMNRRKDTEVVIAKDIKGRESYPGGARSFFCGGIGRRARD